MNSWGSGWGLGGGGACGMHMGAFDFKHVCKGHLGYSSALFWIIPSCYFSLLWNADHNAEVFLPKDHLQVILAEHQGLWASCFISTGLWGNISSGPNLTLSKSQWQSRSSPQRNYGTKKDREVTNSNTTCKWNHNVHWNPLPPVVCLYYCDCHIHSKGLQGFHCNTLQGKRYWQNVLYSGLLYP